jgi:hypothetical protein
LTLTHIFCNMYKILISISLLALIASLGAYDPDNDWENLFNGRDLDGWVVKCIGKDKDKTFWSVEDGCIVCNSMDSGDHNYVWLQSRDEFDNFELRLKFQVARVTRGNSGVQFRSRYDDKAVVEDGNEGWMDGPQCDIEPNDPWRNGFIYDETRETKRWINPSLPNWEISKEEYAPERVVFYFEDEESGWNDLTIICKGMQIKTIVNKVVVSDFDATGVLDDEAHLQHGVGTKGHFALQLHKNSENLIRFKDIRVRRIE